MPRPDPDSLDIFGAAVDLPVHLARAAEATASAAGLPGPRDIDGVVVMGMGGSGISGDVVAAVATTSLPVPLVVVKSYDCPAFVGPRTLVLAVSFSGNTEETLAAAAAAHDRGAQVVAVCSGGRLAELAASWGAPVVPLIGGIPMPRAGIAALTAPLLVVLGRAGLLDHVDEWIGAAVAQLERRVAQLSQAGNEAETLARQLGRTMPIVYGGDGLGSTAALRWKAQLNENTKIPAFHNVIPELCHNELAGWGQHGDVTRQVFSVVMLRHDHEHPRTGLRFPLVAEQIDEVVADIFEVRAEGEGPLAQFFDLVAFGDFVSLYMAGQENVDPGPIPALDTIKSRLAGSV